MADPIAKSAHGREGTEVSARPMVEVQKTAVTEGASLSERLRSNERLAESDPKQALDEMQELQTETGPHPLILARIASLQLKLQMDESIVTAGRCVELAKSVNNFGVLAELYESFGDMLDHLGVDSHDHLRMAGSLQTREHFDRAVELYRKVLRADPTVLPAVKGLIQIAEIHLKQDDGAEKALSIYDALDEECPGHAFADFVERGRDAASRRLARVR